VTTTTPSPFAASLLFGYVAEFMYESDAPLAERRASVLSLDSELLGNLLGQADPGELLDPLVIRQIDDELQRLAPDRKARGKEGLFDLLRELGPMTPDDLAARHRESRDAVNLWLEELLAERRAFVVTIGESQRIACMDDAARLRDALGCGCQRICPTSGLIRWRPRSLTYFCAMFRPTRCLPSSRSPTPSALASPWRKRRWKNCATRAK
jgi:ATP-dependent Lhr-like helicase